MSEIKAETFEGGCGCGAVRFEYKYSEETQPMFNAFCHCQQCRKMNNAAAVHILGLNPDFFTITKGEDELKEFDPIPTVWRKFCPTCGVGICQSTKGAPFVGTFPATYDVVNKQFVKDLPEVFKPSLHANMENSYIPCSFIGEIARFKDFPGPMGGSNIVYTNDACTESKKLED